MAMLGSPDAGSERNGFRRDEPLARYTTLELGGPAAVFAEASSSEELREILRWANAAGVGLRVLGGGSNVVVADSGVPGLVAAVRSRGIEMRRAHGLAILEVAAGEPWPELVEWSVGEGLAGLECLAGIPGTAGATPIQNVGAYGREVAELLEWVEVIDRRDLETRRVPASRCGFGYRRSRFRERPDEHVITRVAFRLVPGGQGIVRYPELRRRLGEVPSAPPKDVMAAVLELRRSKSMVVDVADPNRRSVGSFFVNPVLGLEEAAAVAARAVALGLVASDGEMPCFPGEGGAIKLSAAWLVERSGFPRGTRRGAVGVSSGHSLALVHHGGATTAELLDLAVDIRDAVHANFGVRLQPEPVMWGFDGDPLSRPRSR